jgi:hypothetical protein
MSAGRRKLSTLGGRSHVTPVGVKDRSALRDEIVRRACSQRLDSQTRVGRPLGGKDAAVADKKVGDIVRASEAVDHAGCGRGVSMA